MARPAPQMRAALTAKVLIVDDDERNAFAASEALSGLGHDLVVASSGPEALRILLTEEFAVILMDLHMPGMDGYETARLIREHPRTRDTPIVFVTAVFRDEAHIFQAYTVGAVDVVFKPVDPFILRSKVAILVDLHLKTLEVRRQAEESMRLLAENARVNAEKAAAERALQQSRRRQEAILASLPIVFHSRASESPYAARFVSDNVEPLTGFTAGAFVEDPNFGLDRVHPDDQATVARALDHALETGSYRCEYRWRRADEAYRLFLDQGVVAPDPGPDGAREIFGTLVDVTEQRSLEQQLTQARKMEAVGQLTGGVAHDFNNLLTVVLGNADVLLRRSAGDARLKRQLSSIRFAAERGQTLTNQLLAFARRQQLKPTVVEINDLVRTFTPLIRQAVGDAVTVEQDLAEGSLRANVDPNQLETALLNLAVNARDAMAKVGRLTLSTRLVTPSAGGGSPEVRIGVQDTGEGMTAEVAGRIFEPFYTTKEVGKGSGLGLSQVYGFVSQSGGRVTVTSELGQGAIFELFLPLTDAAAETRAAPAAGPLPAGTGENILVVEDDPEVRALCVDVLADLGYRCATAASGQEALDRLASGESYALLFSDVVMPGGLNGVELARQAIAAHPALKVLLTSGYLGADAGLQAHEFPLLDKPYRRETLAARLNEALGVPASPVRAHVDGCAGSRRPHPHRH